MTEPQAEPWQEEWRVVDWDMDCLEVLIEYRDSSKSDWIAPPEDDELDFERLSCDASDDYNAAGIPLHCGDAVSHNYHCDEDCGATYRLGDRPNPSRWRPAHTMPEWAKRK